MSSDDGDPLDWTVDQVVNCLCYSSSIPWCQSSSTAPRPDPVSFEATLRENLINGETLLNDVDKDALRQDLGLRALGHRSFVLAAIRYLRQASIKYRRSSIVRSPVLDDHSQAVSPSYLSSTAPFSTVKTPGSLLYSSHPLADTVQQQGTQSPAFQTTAHTTNSSLNRSTNPVETQTTASLDKEASENGGTRETSEHHKRVISQLPDNSDGTFTTSHLRPQEHYIVGSDGKKRRRLDLGSKTEAAISNVATGSPDALVQQKPRSWYIGPNKMTPDELFYPILPDKENNQTSFTMVSPGFPRSHHLFVKRCLHHFYRQQPVSLSDEKGSEKWAIIPYRDFSVPGHPCHFTLFSSQDGRISVSQEDMTQWPQLNQKGDAQLDSTSRSQKSKDPYEYLLQKYPAKEGDEDAHPLYGDSGSEGEYDDDTWREIQEERQEERKEATSRRERRLNLGEIDSIMEQCVKDYEGSWRRDHLPREEKKARRIWILARKGRSRNQQTIALLRDINLLEDRMRKLQRNIRLNEYTKVQDLKTQCLNMEQTVFSIQAQKWRISILEQGTCPPRISFSPPKPKRVAKPPDLDEESLGSETDQESDDELDEFIDYDLDNTEQYIAGGSVSAEGMPESDKTPSLSDMQVDSSSDSEYDAISPSGQKRKLLWERRHSARRQVQMLDKIILPPPSSPTPLQAQEVECIDLTRDSPPPGVDDFDIITPPLNPVRPADNEKAQSPVKDELLSSPPPPLQLEDIDRSGASLSLTSTENKSHTKPELPGFHDFKGLQRVDWDLLEERHDRCRLLSKLVAGLPDGEPEQMLQYIPHYDKSHLQESTLEALRLLLQHTRKMRNLDGAENDVIMRTASLYISWVNCVKVSDKGIPRKQIQRAISEIDGFSEYAEELDTRLAQYCNQMDKAESRRRKASKPGTSKRAARRYNEDKQQDSSLTPHKKRKREVKERQEVKQNHANAQLRAAIQERQRKRLEQSMESVGVSNDDPSRQAVTFEAPIIYLDPHIGRRVKPHQLRGVQFMWRELIQDEKRQGCLLAHTMGLGKTMQVISLLVTISAAAASTDPDIRALVPASFHRSQTLILCPSSLIDNWYEEFLMWTPRKNHLGPVRKITSASAFGERIRELSAWDEQGGVLIMSYDIFRTWVHNKETKARGRPLEVEDHVRIKDQLLDGPNIIVADEAHKMKNRAAGISAAASEFRSRSRIALTGSPLANNLVDYYAMVDWIAPGYLGNFVEFKANYVEPIEDGLYVDSTYAERRKCLKKLQVLKENLGPKIDRADISVLEGSLPPKVEFVITVPLTDLQKEAYDMYVNSILAGRSEVGTAKLWSWLAILSLCCNHPACFSDKLLSQSDRPRKQGRKSDDFDSEELPGDESPIQAGLPETMITSQKELFAKIEDLRAPGLSYRAQILDQIICESVRAGDKVLVFSHSLPTLDYIEHMLKLSERSYLRLDGHTPIFSRQAATKNFNQSSSNQQVYLISTRAGGLGLNIPGANRVVIFDFSFSPTWEEQAVGRAYRLGQQKSVYVYRFIAGGTFEQVMYNKAVFKTQLSSRVVDKRNPIRWASKSLKEYLFPSESVKTEDVSEYIGKDPDVLDKIIQRDEHKTIRKIELTETFQREDNDKLTEEEKRDVKEQLNDEILKRNDPEAYYKKLRERQAANSPASTWEAPASYTTPVFDQTHGPIVPAPLIPSDAHANAPPLEPDMSIQSQPNPVSESTAVKVFSGLTHTIILQPSVSGTTVSLTKDPTLPSNQTYSVATATQDNDVDHEISQDHVPSTTTAESEGTVNNTLSSKASSPISSDHVGKTDCKQQ